MGLPSFTLATAFVTIFYALAPPVNGHGRLIEPPSRASMWRYGFADAPANYNDHELYCGGFSRQWQTNGGKCGVCGDPWDVPQPRPHEAGGKYGRGVVVRRYRRDQPITVKIELTANHMGHFEFHICPNNNPRQVVSQTCLDRYPLRLADGSGTDYRVGPGNRIFDMTFFLPKGLTCTQCVLQWRYIAGNNWGVCKNGTQGVGCGPQEEFRACADVTITELDGTADSRPDSNKDNEVIPPPHLPGEPSSGQDWNQDTTAEATNPARIVIIIFAAIITTGLLFLGLFLYYYKAREPLKAFVKDRNIEWPSLGGAKPSLWLDKFSIRPKTSYHNWTSRVQESFGRINWPLSAAGSKLPAAFTQQRSSPVVVSPVASDAVTPSRLGQHYSGPVPPPRARRSTSRCSSPGLSAASSSRPSSTQPPTITARLATIQPRRPPAPPPAAPPSAPLSRHIEISAPTQVTINGVSVGGQSSRPSPMAQTAPSGPRPTSSGIICAARPARILADIPDSSLEVSLPPPPLPTCPPPDSLSLDDNMNNSTDA